MSAHTPQVGDAVRITAPPYHYDRICAKYSGQTGTIEEIEADGMISIRFPDGYRDGFYSDEIEPVST